MTREEFIKKYVSSASWGDAAGCIYDYVESKLGQPCELKTEVERLLNEVNICRAVLGIKPDERIPVQEVSYGSILVEKPSGARMRISPVNKEIVELEKESSRQTNELKRRLGEIKHLQGVLEGKNQHVTKLEAELTIAKNVIKDLQKPIQIPGTYSNRDGIWIRKIDFDNWATREHNARIAAEKKLENISKIADKAIQCCFEGQDVWAGLESIRREIKK